MLMASSSAMVGAMKIQAIARSDRPRTRRARTSGVARAARSAVGTRGVGSVIGSSAWRPLPHRRRGRRPHDGLLQLALFLEGLGPVAHQRVQGLLGGSLVGHDVVVDPLL